MAETADEGAPRSYAELPLWSKTLAQLSFAGAFIAYVFIAGREDRTFIREQLEAERAVFHKAIDGMNKAVDSLEESQRLIKKLDDDRNPRFLAPPPKLKPTT